MKKLFLFLFIGFFIQQAVPAQNVVKLPKPSYKGEVSLEEVLYRRKSVRQYKDKALSLEELAQLLFSCAGKSIDGLSGPTRAAPSAGGIYPVDVYVFAAKVAVFNSSNCAFSISDIPKSSPGKTTISEGFSIFPWKIRTCLIKST